MQPWQTYVQSYGDAATTALGFFWKSGWAFVLGYFISAMIQVFVPKAKLTRHMGRANAESVSLATLLGAVSSSCSFAALAAARALVSKGAHFIAAVAFMFASTNLVIELGILILIFLGWPFLAAEIVGGLVLIAVSSLLIRLTYPRRWLTAAREKVEAETPEEESFDWRRRIRSARGWRRVGRQFAAEWAMVWEEILIGFTIAGFVAVLVPARFWSALFLVEASASLPAWLVSLENAAVAPFVAAATFIGSMGNIPLATVLNAHGVLFAGIMGFIYSDLMVPPLVRINARYYGWRVALYIAGVMYASILVTALLLDAVFRLLDIVPESRKAVEEVTRFELDYTFWMNLGAVALVVWLLWLRRAWKRKDAAEAGHGHDPGEAGGIPPKRIVAWLAAAVLAGGVVAWWWTGGG
jgi:hypothetical protein